MNSGNDCCRFLRIHVHSTLIREIASSLPGWQLAYRGIYLLSPYSACSACSPCRLWGWKWLNLWTDRLSCSTWQPIASMSSPSPWSFFRSQGWYCVYAYDSLISRWINSLDQSERVTKLVRWYPRMERLHVRLHYTRIHRYRRGNCRRCHCRCRNIDVLQTSGFDRSPWYPPSSSSPIVLLSVCSSLGSSCRTSCYSCS